MSDIIEIDEDLAKKICADFLNNKNYIIKDDIVFALKEVLKQYSITDIDFLNLKNLVKCLCILKNINYQKDYVESKLEESFDIKSIFKRTKQAYFKTNFNKEIVHKSIIKTLDSVCEKISNKTNKFELRFKKTRLDGYCYIIKKNQNDAYLLFNPNMYQDEIYIKRFQSLEIDVTKLSKNFLTGRKVVTKHRLKFKVPYLDGFFLDEIEMVIPLIEEQGEQLVLKE